ncbi:glycosyltransferase [Spiroplasma chinense]|uniref:Glycosyltransferase n=1 Tax=Spiroplasma chinense TaxID=216932 RepID=A0A5B9Y2S0_9MOLU|nr:glycosyltransferase family 2 protein [Spiroplasma chinense]QEH61338.1 glycosyltransferase [Spiroplasma chinense]
MLLSFVVVSQDTNSSFEKTIDSIYAQTDNDYEVIIVSDKSMADNAKEVYGRDKFWNNNNVKLVLNNSIQGLSVSWNTAIDLAEGKYIKFVNQGDSIKPNYVEEMKKTVEKFKSDEIDIIEYDVQLVGLTNTTIETYLEKDNVYELANCYDPYAYTNSILFNKVFRTKLLQDFGFKFRRFVRFDMLFIYKVLGQTDKFLYRSGEPLEEVMVAPVQYSAFDLVNQWTHILNYYRRIAKFKDLKDYLNYAYYKTMVHIWLWMIKHYDNKLLLKKASSFVERKFAEKQEDFVAENKVFKQQKDARFTEICTNFSKYIKDMYKLAK